MENCQRCLNNKISLQCLHCPTINKICLICDKIIHNTTSKINHVRLPIENITINIKDNISFEKKKELNENQISNNKDRQMRCRLNYLFFCNYLRAVFIVSKIRYYRGVLVNKVFPTLTN